MKFAKNFISKLLFLLQVSTINIIPEKDNPDEVTYLWKGPQRLGLRGKTEEKTKITLSSPAGFQPFSIVQILPPAAITAIALSASWSLVAVGTAHGLALYDFKAEAPVFHRCTLNSNGKKIGMFLRKKNSLNFYEN